MFHAEQRRCGSSFCWYQIWEVPGKLQPPANIGNMVLKGIIAIDKNISTKKRIQALLGISRYLIQCGLRTISYALLDYINANQRVLEIWSPLSSLCSSEVKYLPRFTNGLDLIGLIKGSNPRLSSCQNIQCPPTCSVYQLMRWNNGINKTQSKGFFTFNWLWCLFMRKVTERRKCYINKQELNEVNHIWSSHNKVRLSKKII